MQLIYLFVISSCVLYVCSREYRGRLIRSPVLREVEIQREMYAMGRTLPTENRFNTKTQRYTYEPMQALYEELIVEQKKRAAAGESQIFNHETGRYESEILQELHEASIANIELFTEDPLK